MPLWIVSFCSIAKSYLFFFRCMPNQKTRNCTPDALHVPSSRCVQYMALKLTPNLDIAHQDQETQTSLPQFSNSDRFIDIFFWLAFRLHFLLEISYWRVGESSLLNCAFHSFVVRFEYCFLAIDDWTTQTCVCERHNTPIGRTSTRGRYSFCDIDSSSCSVRFVPFPVE